MRVSCTCCEKLTFISAADMRVGFRGLVSWGWPDGTFEARVCYACDVRRVLEAQRWCICTCIVAGYALKAQVCGGGKGRMSVKVRLWYCLLVLERSAERHA